MMHTAEIISAVRCTLWRWCTARRGDPFRRVQHTLEIVSVERCTLRRSLYDRICENETENTLGCLSGAQMASNHEKYRGQKSRDPFPLSKMNLFAIF